VAHHNGPVTNTEQRDFSKTQNKGRISGIITTVILFNLQESGEERGMEEDTYSSGGCIRPISPSKHFKCNIFSLFLSPNTETDYFFRSQTTA
jgi:hypothetical protein